MAPVKFASPLEASSYHHPTNGSYASLRAAVVQKATAMGYDLPTMSEHGVSWVDDQDPFGHVTGAAYPRLGAVTGFRMFESFAEQLKDKFDDLLKARGIGMLVKSYEIEINRSVSYPDSIIVATRITEVKLDRYFAITSFWSLKQQAIVAYSRGYVIFFDYTKGRPANLLEAGGVYADLHVALTERAKRSDELAAQWKKDNPPTTKGKDARL